jgi:hypothetical protein
VQQEVEEATHLLFGLMKSNARRGKKRLMIVKIGMRDISL